MSRDVETILLRLRYLCSRYGKLAAIALVVVSSLALAGSAVAYTAPPETKQVTQQTDVQSFTTTVNTSAAVTGNTTLYSPDDQLANMPVYLLEASPEMTLQAHTAVPDDRSVAVTQQITMELYATRDEEVFWTETETLATDARRVTDGTVVTETTVDIRELRQGRLQEVQPEVKNVGTLHAKLHVDTVYNTEKYDGHLTVTTPVEITDRAYAIETPQSAEHQRSTAVTRTLTNTDEQITFGAPTTADTTAQAGIGPSLGGGAIALPKESVIWGGVGVVGLLTALVVWRFYTQSPDWKSLKRTYNKTRYGEWISLGTVPEADGYEEVRIEGLTDLLDIAIDCNKRIIHDPTQGRYAVVDDSVLYEYNEVLDQIDAYIDVAEDEQINPGSQEPFFAPSDTETDESVWEEFDADSDLQIDPTATAPDNESSPAEMSIDPQPEPQAETLPAALSADDTPDTSVWNASNDAIDRSDATAETDSLWGSLEDSEETELQDQSPDEDVFGEPADD